VHRKAAVFAYDRAMRKGLVSLIVFATTVWGECASVTPVETRYGSLEVVAYSNIGDVLDRVEIELFEAGSQKAVRRSTKGRLERVPFGKYTVRVFSPGFKTHRIDVNVDQPKVTVRTQLAVSIECADDSTLDGSVSSAQRHPDLWVKVLPMRGPGGFESKVNSGTFSISGLDAGDYVLMVLDGESVLHHRLVRVVGTTKVSVELASRL
jgi:hypothetical protein